MEHIWQVSGCYANWTLTLTAEPAEDDVPVRVPEFSGLADHMDAAVNRMELGRDMEWVGKARFRPIG